MLEGPKAVVVEGRLRSNNVLAIRDATFSLGLDVARVDVSEAVLARFARGMVHFGVAFITVPSPVFVQ